MVSLRSPVCGLISWTVAAGTETPPGPRTWPVIDPVAGAWPESAEGSRQANAHSAKKTGMSFMCLVNIPSRFDRFLLELTIDLTIINLARLQAVLLRHLLSTIHSVILTLKNERSVSSYALSILD